VHCTMATNLAIRLDSATKKVLYKLATATGRTRAFLVQEALSQYVSEQSWQVAQIRKAVKEADKGEFATERGVTETLTHWSEDAH
jgi:RHH-type transcriptional regulator, rel operon repressor / antitoxin RelB